MTSGTGETETYAAFISHAGQDKAAAEALVAGLERGGLRCWIAPRDIRPGAEYGAEIIRGIAQSQCFVLLLSGASNLSGMVRREVERAASRGRPIYPIRIEDVAPSTKLEYFISMHQWIDAWPKLMAEHVDRLINAIQSDEEWIGNKVRRRRTLSFGVALMLAAVLVGAAVLLTPELRRPFISDRGRAIEDLRARNIPVDMRSMVEALAGADGAVLSLLTRAGVSTTQVAEALSQSHGGSGRAVAETFFERSRTAPAATAWFESALAAGLDPDLVTKTSTSSAQALLGTAMAEGNATAAVAILQAGGSPHAYQDLWFVAAPTPRFLLPYSSALGQQLSDDDQRRLLSALRDAGGVFYNPSGNGRVSRAVTRLLSKTGEQMTLLLGAPPAETPADAKAGRTPICERASARTGVEWCRFASDLASTYAAVDSRSFYDIHTLQIRNMIFATAQSAHFLAVANVETDPRLLLVEAPRSGADWEILDYRDKGAGLGFCRADRNGREPDRCWRKLGLKVDRAGRTLSVGGEKLVAVP